jgi:hypothetical protein
MRIKLFLITPIVLAELSVPAPAQETQHNIHSRQPMSAWPVDRKER